MITGSAAIAGFLARVEERIADTCVSCGRARDEVTLVAVSKRIPLPLVVAACAAGQRDFGENRIQDAIPRQTEIEPLLAAAGLPADVVRWHFIGHLQRNKASKAVGAFSLLHAVDSLRLVTSLAALAAERQQPQPWLLEVNLTRESQKHGIASESALELLAAAAEQPLLEPAGLMTMARYGADEAELRKTFAALRRLSETLRTATGLSLPHLSMGMSNDFPQAIAEGATLIRIGTAIFGPRA
ncbi:MAG: YggS family pyridoxal phosphate-dependent enzyme [bacterium]